MCNDAAISSAAAVVRFSPSFGNIERVVDDVVVGWLFTPRPEGQPLLAIDGRPAELVEWPGQRPDVRNELGITDDTGFRFRVPYLKVGSLIELFALQGNTLRRVHTLRADHSVIEQSPLHQLVNARNAAAEPGAVAVTCWDAAHNPVGRAKVLYDIIAKRRPAVLFAYLFAEFGSGIWSPLKDSDIRTVLIPWVQRDLYHALIRQMGIAFDTVWLCKPRYPTFCLAEQVAAPDARLILDADDNEEHFASSGAAREKAYGSAFINLSRNLMSQIRARTVASVSLQNELGGELVRHAREARLAIGSDRDPGRPAKVGFIGTVRPHKNIAAAARALKLFNWLTGTQTVFHVYGDVEPASLRAELIALGVRVRETIPSSQLTEMLDDMDVILAGFPSPGTEHAEVTRYQITAKVGDALGAGKPVLVPDAESVTDLRNEHGVFLFDEAGFGSALQAALTVSEPISLPHEFTVDGAYANFEVAEQLADVSPRAGAVFGGGAATQSADVQAGHGRNLLLVWKQNDAGLYGRRIDQIARTYKRRHPASRVIVLELMHEKNLERYSKGATNSIGEASQILALSGRKVATGHVDEDGVVYREIRYRSSDLLRDHVLRFLAENGLNPANTVSVLFPIIDFLEKIQDVVCAFPTIVDVVDNQFSWVNGTIAKDMACQYASLLISADHVVFNSPINREHFLQRFGSAFYANKESLISNWYYLPGDYNFKDLVRGRDGNFHILYSGNMNDRLDWSLIEMIADWSDEVRLHLVGSAQRAGGRFHEALKKENIVYHGVLPERAVLNCLRTSHLAIMPHTADTVSNFMNPLKLHMYAAMGVPIATTCVEGITSDSPAITRHPNRASFLAFVTSQLERWREERDVGAEAACAADQVTCSSEAEQYMQVIESLYPRGSDSVANSREGAATVEPKTRLCASKSALADEF